MKKSISIALSLFVLLQLFAIPSFVTAPPPTYDLTVQKVCKCSGIDDFTFWFEVTNKNDYDVDYYYEVYQNAGNILLYTSATHTILAGEGPSNPRLDFFKVTVTDSQVPGTVRVYLVNGDDFQQAIGFNPPNFTECENCINPSFLEPTVTLVAEPSDCLYAQPDDKDIPSVITAYVFDYTGAAAPDGTNVVFGCTSDIAYLGDVTGTRLTGSGLTIPTTGGSAVIYLYQIASENESDTHAYESGLVEITAEVTMDVMGYTLSDTDFVQVGICPRCDALTLLSQHNILDPGTTTSLLSAFPKDYADNPMPEGFVVNFSTTIGTITDVTTTNASGVATAVLHYDVSAAPSIAYVTASGQCGSDATIEVSFNEAESGVNLELTAVPNPVPLCSVDGTEITALLLDDQDQPVSGEDIIFTIVSETENNGSGTFSDSTDVDTETVATDTNGEASVTLYNDQLETIVVQAAVNSTYNITTSISVVFDANGTVDTLEITSPDKNDEPIELDTCLPESVDIIVKLTGCQYVLDGVDIHFATTAGHFLDSSTEVQTTTVQTDADGNAQVTLYPSGSVEMATVTASCDCGHSDTINFSFVAGAPYSIIASTDKLVMPADGKSVAIISTEVYDACGNPVNDGVEVCFSTDFGTLLYVPPKDSTIHGIAQIPLESFTTPQIATIVACICETEICDEVQVEFVQVCPGPTDGEGINQRWTPFVMKPIVDLYLQQTNEAMECLMSQELPEQAYESLDRIQLIISEASTFANPIYASHILSRALDALCELSSDLEYDCCEQYLS